MNTGKAKTVVLGVTGSISAYKACELTRLMIKEGWEVHVVMTAAAEKFVTPLTFQTLSRNKVVTGMFEPVTEWKPEHVALAQAADIFVIAPCTANVIAKLAHGLADDSLTATALAYRGRIYLAPAMNDGMFANQATQANLEILSKRGFVFAEPGEGDLACGTAGRGRMASPEEIFNLIKKEEC